MFRDQSDIPVSGGSICNFNKEAYDRLEDFESAVRSKLISADVCHADETGINIDGKRRWLHCVSNDRRTFFLPHGKRGAEAMNDMGVLPFFTGVLCHDHRKPYFSFDCGHSLCNAHHLRELQRSWEQDGQQWAGDTGELLPEINTAVDDAGGRLPPEVSLEFRHRYRSLLETAQTECPAPDEKQRKGKRGRLKRSKARNLLERLTEFENETLCFMDDEKIPFTNNRGENDIRMTKVRQKISGCFRSMKGAKIFCRVRSCLQHAGSTVSGQAKLCTFYLRENFLVS